MALVRVWQWYGYGAISASMAPAPKHIARGNRRIDRPSIPPSAATGNAAARASRPHRCGPSAAAPGWLRVAKAGDRNARSTLARAARRRSAAPCAELVSRVPRRRAGTGAPVGHLPPRRCTPAPSAAASRGSPVTTSLSRRARQSRARSRPSVARAGSESWRSTTPASPLGRRATTGRGSANRCESVNSHNGGR